MEDTERPCTCGASRPTSVFNIPAALRYPDLPTLGAGMVRKAVVALAIMWLLLTGPFVVGTICSEYTRGLLLKFAVNLPPHGSPALPRPGIQLTSPARVSAGSPPTTAVRTSPLKVASQITEPKNRPKSKHRLEVPEKSRGVVLGRNRYPSPRRYVSTSGSTRPRRFDDDERY